MSNPTVKVVDNGPIVITGQIELVDGEGNRIATTETTKLCRCGLSANKPFCNGAHKGQFESAVRA